MVAKIFCSDIEVVRSWGAVKGELVDEASAECFGGRFRLGMNL
jgi:hypothetical protein